jgi:hypothetical protein
VSTAEILGRITQAPEERREIRTRLAELDDAWDDGGELSESEKKLIEERMADFEKNPNTSIPWTEAEARLKARWGE